MAQRLPLTSASIRLAKANDLDRLAVVAFAGGILTQEFTYQRPFANDYPEDVLDSWKFYLAEHLTSQYKAVIVIEDNAVADDLESTIAADTSTGRLLEGARVVVGFAQYEAKAGHPKDRKFERIKVEQTIWEGQKRDQYPQHYQEFNQCARAETMVPLIDAKLSLDTLIVYPSYHRRGHGKALVQWAIELAKIDQVSIGVLATKMGIPLYEKLGFRKVKSFELPADSVSDGVYAEVMILAPEINAAHGTNCS